MNACLNHGRRDICRLEDSVNVGSNIQPIWAIHPSLCHLRPNAGALSSHQDCELCARHPTHGERNLSRQCSGVALQVSAEGRIAIPQRGLHKCCWLRLWIVLRLWMSGPVQLLVTLRNKLLCTLRHLRQQLRHSLRASEIRLRRTVRTDFLLRVPAAPRVGERWRSTRKQSPSPW